MEEGYVLDFVDTNDGLGGYPTPPARPSESFAEGFAVGMRLILAPRDRRWQRGKFLLTGKPPLVRGAVLPVLAR